MENKIEFHTQTNSMQDSWVMCITTDRRIEVNEDVEVTEAAQKVLDAMQLLLTPQRTWVGLTDEELELLNDCGDTDSYKFAHAIEAKLKEKNK